MEGIGLKYLATQAILQGASPGSGRHAEPYLPGTAGGTAGPRSSHPAAASPWPAALLTACLPARLKCTIVTCYPACVSVMFL